MAAPALHHPAVAGLFDHLSDAVYLLDPDTSHIVWGNRAAWESLGLTRDAVLDHSVLSLQKDVTGLPHWSEIAAVIRSAPCFTFVGRHRHALGHEVPVEVNTTRFVDQGREYFLSVARDISRRVALEADLKTRENQLWFALNEAMDGLWDWDLLSHEVFFSPQLKRMLGYGPDEMAPTLDSWTRNIHPDDADRVQRLLGAHLAGRAARYEADYRLRTRNGHYLWVQDRGKVCERDAAGAATRVVGMVQDVTEQRRAQAALQRVEVDQRTLIAALPDVIMRFDRAGRHLHVSENVAALAPLTAAQIVGKTHRELGLPEALCEHWDRSIEGVFSTRQGHESEFELDGPLGRRTINWRLVPDLDDRAEVRSVLAICRDITERKQAEAELARHRHHLEELVEQRTQALSVAKEAAEAANRAKSSFLAHMSHELRTPMSAILGMTALARHRAQDPVLREHLGRVDQASQHLLSLINDILDLSKIEAERMTLDDTPFPLGSVMDGLLQLAGHRAEEKGLQLVPDLSPALRGQLLRGDPLRLKQILLNLVDNAVKFTAAGAVTVRGRVEAEEADALRLRFEVSDSGIGIAPELHHRVFTAFEQADNTTTRRYGGTGLGLAISKRLVEMMDGEIGVHSHPGQGSLFWFTVRLRRADGSAMPAQPGGRRTTLDTLRGAHAGARILLVEDDAVSREVSMFQLQHAGLEVHTAEDGEQALQRAREHRYALILMDMQMPRMNGIDATHAIRAQSLNPHTPIVALTANAFDDDRQRCLDAGMDAHLGKPVDAGLLFDMVLQQLERSPR